MNLEFIENILAYELVRRALLTRAILTFFRGWGGGYAITFPFTCFALATENQISAGNL